MRVVTVQHRHRGAQGRDLRQRQIYKHHAALHHVDAQIRVDAGQNQAGDEGGQQEGQNTHLGLFNLIEGADQQIYIVIEQLEVIRDFLDTPH